MTLQEVFNNALFGIRAQGYVRSYSVDHQSCMYRGPDGRKCHIGHSIRDDQYHPSMEGCTAISAVIYVLFPGIDREILDELQRIHDARVINDNETYEQEMRGFAEAHDLEYTAP